LQPGRDTKAELNRRSQVCDALAGTGVRVAKMGINRGCWFSQETQQSSHDDSG
jgi:hypothetical protein